MSKNDFISFVNSAGSAFVQVIAFVKLPVTASQQERDVFALELAKKIKMEPNGKAAEYLDHFLSGGGTPKRFKLDTLINQDRGVKERVIGEITRRSLGIKTQRERAIDSRMSLSKNAKRDRHIITIFQKTFKNKDWHLALGTFPLDWEIIDENKNFITANVWGSNKYQWHPDSRRITQFLHQAGHRLNQSKEAKPRNFDIIAEPIQVKVSRKYRSILEISTLTQTNPSYYKGPY